MGDFLRDRIDPELLDFYDASKGFDFDHLEDFVSRMNAMELLSLQEDSLVSTSELEIPGPDGAPPIKLRIYSPANAGEELLPGLMFFHGGGFLFGTVYRQEALCQKFVKNTNCVVISVEYRLAPKWRAPAPVEDGYAALCWLSQEGEKIGVDGSRIALSGLSAGGTIVAALSLMTRDRGGPKPIFQMPLYGEMDWRLLTDSSREITSPKVWCRENNQASWDLYLGEDKAVTYYDSPALCEDLSNLPPAFSFVGGLDPVRDENLAFWQQLMAAGVPVEGHVFPGCFHCFELANPEAAVSKKAYDLMYAALKSAFSK